MTKTDFAELKERLTKIDYVAANAYLTRYMEGGYEEPTYQQYGDYIHTKSAAIISELIEIIEDMHKELDEIRRISTCGDETTTELDCNYIATDSIDQTTTRLQKLRDGK